MNLYGFVNNNGVNRWDLLGLSLCKDKCEDLEDAGNRRGWRTKAGFINATARGNAGIFEAFDDVIDALNNVGTLEAILSLVVDDVATGALTGGATGAATGAANNLATAAITAGYNQMNSAAVDAIQNMLGDLSDQWQQEPGLNGSSSAKGVRMDVYYEWQTCECKYRIFWTTMKWSDKKEEVFHCHFNKKDNKIYDDWQMGDQKGRANITKEDIVKCFIHAEKRFKEKICGDCGN